MPYFRQETIEGAIERKYMPTLIQLGLSQKDAEEAFERFVKAATGKTVLPGAGDALLEDEKTNDKRGDALRKLRQQGVRDDDIRSWWNMHPLEHACIYGIDEMMRMASFIEQLRKNLPPDQATRQVFKYFGRWGDPDSASWGGEIQDQLTDDDRPLPIELFNTVGDYFAAMQREPTFADILANSSSFNATVRQAIRNGELHRVATLRAENQTREPSEQPSPKPMPQPFSEPPIEEWRNWPQHIAKIEALLGPFDSSEGSQNEFIRLICKYVWETAKGDNASKQECLVQAFKDAGFDAKPGTSLGTIHLRRFFRDLGFTMKTGDNFKFVRPSKTSGCAVVLLVLIVLGATTVLGR